MNVQECERETEFKEEEEKFGHFNISSLVKLKSEVRLCVDAVQQQQL